MQAGNDIHQLKPDQEFVAGARLNHRFFNPFTEPCRFRCRIEPASVGFEWSLQIAYGLARDGQTNAKGLTADKLALAWLFSISESNLPGWRSIFEGLLRWQARRAVASGVDKRLTEKYVRF